LGKAGLTRDVQSEVIDLYDEMSAYVLFLGAVVEVVNVLEIGTARTPAEQGYASQGLRFCSWGAGALTCRRKSSRGVHL
jgi:hypothetical protein